MRATPKRLEAFLEPSVVASKVVALLPELIPVDEWRAIASNMQAELKANIKKDCCRPQYDKGDLSHLVVTSE